MQNIRQLTKFMAVAILAVSLTACAMFSGRESAGEYVDDAAITSKVKAEILEDPALKVLEVNVETMQGVVQLSGFVDSQQSEAKAVDIVRHVHGVKSVKDDLVVR